MKPMRIGQIGRVPPGAVVVGNYIMFPDNEGFLHPSPQEAVASNIRIESNTRTVTGENCGQDPSLVPPLVPKIQEK